MSLNAINSGYSFTMKSARNGVYDPPGVSYQLSWINQDLLPAGQDRPLLPMEVGGQEGSSTEKKGITIKQRVILVCGDLTVRPVSKTVKATCWVYSSVENTRAVNNFIEKTPPLAAEEFVHRVYPGEDTERGGHMMAAVDYIRREGVSTLDDYVNPNGGGVCIFAYLLHTLSIAYFQHIYMLNLILEDQNTLLEAVRSQPITINVPLSSGFINYKKGLLNLQLAEETHKAKDCPYDISKVNGHSLLIVGWGIFEPTVGGPNNPTRYWIIRNQWTEERGIDGYGFVLWNSSALELRQLKKQLSVRQQCDYEICFGRVAPLVDGYGYQRSQQFHPLYIEPNTLDELEQMIEDRTNKDMTYIVLFYKSGFEEQCQVQDCRKQSDDNEIQKKSPEENATGTLSNVNLKDKTNLHFNT